MIDASASAQSRVYSAMLLLVEVFDRRYPEYSNFVSTGTYSVCQVGSVYGSRSSEQTNSAAGIVGSL